MAEIKEFRLGGAGRFSVTATGSKTRLGAVYTKIILRCDRSGYAPDDVFDVTTKAVPLNLACTAAELQFLTAIVTEARKHLAMGSV